MRKLMVRRIWVSAFLLTVFAIGCSDPDKNAGTGSPGAPLTPPTVTSVTPLNASIAVCPNTGIITATFSKAMNPNTLTVTTFTLTGPPNATSVSGAVTYDATTLTATFTPSSSLAVSIVYTATITTGAQDTFGNSLSANMVWTFTTASTACGGSGGAALALGASCSFGILGATPSVTSNGPTTVSGDVGVWPAISIVGFPPGTLTGVLHPGDSVAMTAQGDLTTAYNNAAAAPGGAVLTADIGGQTLAPGVYKTTSAQPSLGITGNLTLAGQGTYIFQIVSTLTTAAGSSSVPASQVILAGGASAHDVFWQVGTSATLGTFSNFAGTIMANASITVTNGAKVNGRLLARTATVTLNSNPITVPSCP
jgi:hypothetical protein